MVAIDPDDFTDELVVAHFHLFHSLARRPPEMKAVSKSYQLVHGNTGHVLGNDDGSGGLLSAIVGTCGRSVVATDPETE